MAVGALCGNIIPNHRSLLAMGWATVNIATFVAFLFAISFAVDSGTFGTDDDMYNYNCQGGQCNNQEAGGNDPNEQWNNESPSVAITSQAMAFAAIWTAVIASMLGIFGTVVLGVVSPMSGTYYACCAQSVHRTTPMSIGVFIGSLLMFANMTLVSAVMFGEFQIRDFYEREGDRGGPDAQYYQERNVERSSKVFSVLCAFLTILYAGFAAMVFKFSHSIIEENLRDAREEALGGVSDDEDTNPGTKLHPTGAYFGGQEENVSAGYVSPEKANRDVNDGIV